MSFYQKTRMDGRKKRGIIESVMKMDVNDISKTMQRYLANGEIHEAELMVRKDDQLVYDAGWNKSCDRPIYRMMSMTKPVVGVAVMMQVEKGVIGLDDPISKYLPAFKDMGVIRSRLFTIRKTKSNLLWILGVLIRLPGILLRDICKMKTMPAKREITVRDLLSHASGLEQGLAGMFAMMKDKRMYPTLADRVEKLSHYGLDFDPGTDTGYSPLAGFDLLLRILEVVTGEEASEHLKRVIFEPLEMQDACFRLSEEQKPRLVGLYKRSRGRLREVDAEKKASQFMCRGERYVSGSGGLYCTIRDYENFARMLCNEGEFHGKRLLQPETVRLMHQEAQAVHLEPEPGYTWGLSVKIRQNKEKGGFACTEGTYGWSGAYGTHFFVSPQDKLECVLTLNRSDVGGSGSYISKKIEELVFGIFS